MGETFAGLVTDGPLLVAAAVAALVGLISFASPCVLPLVPGYLSYVTGPGRLRRPHGGAGTRAGAGGTATAVRTDERSPRGRMVLGALLFVLGFTAVFVAFGTAFGGLGRLMLEHADVLNRVFGVDHRRSSGWLPRLAPAAAAHQAALRPPGRRPGRRAAARHRLRPGLDAVPRARRWRRSTRWPSPRPPPTRGALLGVAYCLGLGVPFVLVALGARWAVGATVVPAPARRARSPASAAPSWCSSGCCCSPAPGPR